MRRASTHGGLQWQIDKMSFSNKDTRTSTGLFMTTRFEGTSGSAGRDRAAVLTSASHVLWIPRRKMRNLFVDVEISLPEDPSGIVHGKRPLRIANPCAALP